MPEGKPAVETNNAAVSKPQPSLTATHEHPDIARAMETLATNAKKPDEGEGGETKEDGKVASATGTDPKAGEKQPVKKKQTFQERIDEVSAEKHEAIRAKEEAERRAAAALQEVETLKRATAPPPPKSPEVIEKDDPRPQRADFEDPELYYEKVAEWSGRKAVREAERTRAEASAKASEEQQRKATEEYVRKGKEAWDKQLTQGRDRYEDFDQVVSNGQGDLTVAAAVAVQASDIGADIFYHLSKNPAELARINALPPAMHALEIGKLDERLRAQMRGRVTKTTKPVEPVGQHNVAGERTLNDIAAEGNMEEYASRRQAEIEAQRKSGRTH